MRYVQSWVRIIACPLAAAVAALPARPTAPAAHSRGTLLIELLAGQTYERDSFAPGGKLTGRSLLRVSSVHAASGGRIGVQIRITSYSPSGKESIRRVDWTCDPGAARMLMDLLMVPVAGAGSPLDLTVSGPPVRYPLAPAVGTTLPDLVVDVRVHSGVLSLLGTRTRVRMQHRTIEGANPPRPDRYRLTSEIETTTYLFALPLIHRRFLSIETLQGGAKLIRHRMIFPNGRYIIIEPLERPAT